MSRVSLRRHHCGYDLHLDGQRIGIVYHEPLDAVWVMSLDVSSRPDAAFRGFADVPPALRDLLEDHESLASLCVALGAAFGGLPIPATPNLSEAA